MSRNDTRAGCNADLNTRIVYELADERGVDPLELDPLYDAVDPDALERLFSAPTSVDRVEFTVGDCKVIVSGDGTVEVSPVRRSETERSCR